MPNESLGPLTCKQTTVLKLNHLGYVKSHGFHDNPYINLKHGQLFFYNFLSFLIFSLDRIDDYAILIILLSDYWAKALCLSIKLVPSLVI